MGEGQDLLYFAYGSNLDPAQMNLRCPDATVVGVARLDGYRLCFPRLSKKRGCGVSSVEPSEGSEIWGVLYRLSSADLRSLDKAEGFVVGRPADENRYNRVEIEVACKTEKLRAATYLANPEEGAPLPSQAYMKHLLDGARYHGLPAGYITDLEKVLCA